MKLILSWDDGHPSDKRLAELLLKYKLKATFFVPAKNSEGMPVMSKNDLRTIDRDFEIGSHTLNHVYLKGLPRLKQQEEINGGKNFLEDILGHEIPGFCYPGGKFDEITLSCLKVANVKYARTIKNFVFSKQNNYLEIATSFQFYPHKKRVLIGNLIKKDLTFERIKFASELLRYFGSNANWNMISDHLKDKQTTLHVWGHSWELDKLNLWPELEIFLKNLVQLKPTVKTLGEYYLENSRGF